MDITDGQRVSKRNKLVLFIRNEQRNEEKQQYMLINKGSMPKRPKGRKNSKEAEFTELPKCDSAEVLETKVAPRNPFYLVSHFYHLSWRLFKQQGNFTFKKSRLAWDKVVALEGEITFPK